LAVIALLLSVLAVAIDRITKILAIQYIKPVGSKTVIGGLLYFNYQENQGAAFSLLNDYGFRWLFVAVTGVVCVFIVFALFRYENHEFFSYGACILILGGGVSNMIDRIATGRVVDFIQLSFFPAIFNFGDCCVTVGTVFLVIHILLFAERKDRAEKVMRMK
jgi:signal peptidase II